METCPIIFTTDRTNNDPSCMKYIRRCVKHSIKTIFGMTNFMEYLNELLVSAQKGHVQYLCSSIPEGKMQIFCNNISAFITANTESLSLAPFKDANVMFFQSKLNVHKFTFYNLKI